MYEGRLKGRKKEKENGRKYEIKRKRFCQRQNSVAEGKYERKSL
jgi:hypothetical protein